jgi:excisionase family DNA binding protein
MSFDAVASVMTLEVLIRSSADDPPEISEVLVARPAGLEPATSGLENIFGGLAQDSNELQATETVRVGTSDRVQRVARKAAIRRQLVTSLLQDAAGNGTVHDANSSGKSTDHGSNVSVRLMTVKEVAKVLRVCTATVYGMIEKGELEHFRVSNAIRVVVRLPMAIHGEPIASHSVWHRWPASPCPPRHCRSLR